MGRVPYRFVKLLPEDFIIPPLVLSEVVCFSEESDDILEIRLEIEVTSLCECACILCLVDKRLRTVYGCLALLLLSVIHERVFAVGPGLGNVRGMSFLCSLDGVDEHLHVV